ncbi:uncharacterized protein LOC132276933 [Cornus florida]|uniref:uncharacterized protein LOC132276933 n=1 Tax=Cornus florida TaxID=4283 RepID=UPI00289967E6|nr:uncharacterized protein LOC132276933 [Cornus florida]
MLETKSGENTNPNSTLIALKPRQVMLAEQNAKKTMTKNDHNKTLTLKPNQKAPLLHSVLRYLEHNCFSKALKRLLSEAQIEDDSWKTCSMDLEDMYCKYLETCGHADVNFNTYKEQELLKDAITKKDGDTNCAASEKTISKKKKKKSDESDVNAAADQSGAAEKINQSTNMCEKIAANDLVIESKRKSKRILDSLGQAEQVSSEALKKHVDDTGCELQMDESNIKCKGNKKKKSTLASGSLDGSVEQEKLDSLPEAMDLVSSKGDNIIDSESKVKSRDKKKKNKLNVVSHAEHVEEPGVENKQGAMAEKLVDGDVEQEKIESLSGAMDLASSKGDNIIDSESNVKSRDKKKKKNKVTVISHAENVEEPGLEDKQGATAEKLVDDSALGNIPDIPLEGNKVKTKDRKRKKDGAVSQEFMEAIDKENPIINESTKEWFQTPENAANKEKKHSKKRKRLASVEHEHQPVEEVATEDSKRRKTEGLEEAKSNEQITKVNPILGGDGHAGEESKGEIGQVGRDDLKKALYKHAIGKLEKNGEEKSALQKTTMKERNGSAEPKTVNAFQRVKVDEVEFADDRLQNNSYWAKGGAEIGYGAKAQEVLGQVRGRDFRHEKTKKKRGSYRGGQIDLQSHSVKFNYSDEE